MEATQSQITEHKENEIVQFKDYWYRHYSFIAMELNNREIQNFIETSPTIEKACDLASDYLLSQGLADVQE